MKLFNSTERWMKWWANRKIDWQKHYMNPTHPHRLLIAQTMQHIPWMSLLEVGCGAGANLAIILKMNPGRQIGGIDINPDAIEFAKKNFSGGLFKVNPADDIMMSDQSADVILSDMCMIYISPFKIGRHLKEFSRVSRSYIVFFELHSESLWDRLVIKWKEGYNVFNWLKVLAKHGYYDIQTYKISPESWPESNLQKKYAHIIVARVPKYL